LQAFARLSFLLVEVCYREGLDLWAVLQKKQFWMMIPMTTNLAVEDMLLLLCSEQNNRGSILPVQWWQSVMSTSPWELPWHPLVTSQFSAFRACVVFHGIGPAQFSVKNDEIKPWTEPSTLVVVATRTRVYFDLVYSNIATRPDSQLCVYQVVVDFL
jgi:hypothetical protein